MAERTWIHAFTDGRDVSPTSAVRRPRRAARATGSPPCRAATTRWTATSAGSGPTARSRAICRGHGPRTPTSPVEAVRASYDAGVTDEFIEPVVIAGGRGSSPERDAAVFFNFRPDRARQLSQRLLERGVDLVTMTRYRDDFPCPVAFAEQEVPRHARRGALRPRGPPAPRRRDREVRARHLLLQRRRRGGVGRRGDAHPRALAARRPELRPEAGDVGARGGRPLRGGGRRRLRFAIVNFANPDMVGHTGVIPAAVTAVETVDECLGRVVAATERGRRRLPRHGRPRQRGAAARGRRRQPAHGAHDEPRAAGPHGRRSRLCGPAEGFATWRRPCWICSESPVPEAMTGAAWSEVR